MIFFILIYAIYEFQGASNKNRGDPREQKTDGVIIYSDQIDNIKRNHCEGRYLCSKHFSNHFSNHFTLRFFSAHPNHFKASTR